MIVLGAESRIGSCRAPPQLERARGVAEPLRDRGSPAQRESAALLEARDRRGGRPSASSIRSSQRSAIGDSEAVSTVYASATRSCSPIAAASSIARHACVATSSCASASTSRRRARNAAFGSFAAAAACAVASVAIRRPAAGIAAVGSSASSAHSFAASACWPSRTSSVATAWRDARVSAAAIGNVPTSSARRSSSSRRSTSPARDAASIATSISRSQLPRATVIIGEESRLTEVASIRSIAAQHSASAAAGIVRAIQDERRGRGDLLGMATCR